MERKHKIETVPVNQNKQYQTVSERDVELPLPAPALTITQQPQAPQKEQKPKIVRRRPNRITTYRGLTFLSIEVGENCLVYLMDRANKPVYQSTVPKGKLRAAIMALAKVLHAEQELSEIELPVSEPTKEMLQNA